MNRSWAGSKTQLINQLVYFDEEKAKFLEQYFTDQSKERTEMEKLLTLYCKKLEQIVADFNETSLQSTVLIGSQVKLRYEDDDSFETYTVVFPEANARRTERAARRFLLPRLVPRPLLSVISR